MRNIIITEQNASLREGPNFYQWVTEASSLGLKPGEWPEKIDTTLGNKMPLSRVTIRPEYVTYRQGFGCLTVDIFND